MRALEALGKEVATFLFGKTFPHTVSHINHDCLDRWPRITTTTQLTVRPPVDRTMSFHTNNDLGLDRLLLDAARTDNVDQLFDVFEEPGKFDINFQDG